ncbi:MAG: PhoH family protein [Candidatus Eisenbacteria bacterium]|nr:PhoH family protein [Candidatus Eisenbacteria bacterium]
MAPPIVQETLSIDGIDALPLLGQSDANLRALEQRFNVILAARGERLMIKGEADAVNAAASVLRALIERVRGGRQIGPEDLEYLLNASEAGESGPPAAGVLPDDGIVFFGDKRVVKVRTPVQARYVEGMLVDDIAFGIGPAGTGKTYLAVAVALRLLREKVVEKIVLARPAVEAGESLGFLPGDLQEKVDPYLRPLYDALQDMVHYEKLQRFMQLGVIEVVPLAYMRGRTLSRAFVILDEAQNATLTQMKMFLTRLGPGSKAAITGDVTQIDLENPEKSGLIQIQSILSGLEGIRFVYFSEKDVVRHRLVRDIIMAFDRQRTAGTETPRR